MKSAIMAGLLVLGLAAPALAVTGIGGFTYDVSIPDGEAGGFTDNTSFRGFGIEARWFRGEHTALGFAWHWNVFHQQMEGTWEVENGHVTGHQFHRVYSSPVLLTFYYQWGNARYGSGWLYYAGLGGGGYWVKNEVEVGTGIHQATAWQLGLCPELGLYYGLSFNAYLNLSAKYNRAFESGGHKGRAYFCLCLGIAWVR